MSDDEQKKILIVDDDSVVLRTMKDGLSGRYKIFGAGSGSNALKVLEKIKPDLVLLDFEMPEMTGPDVLDAMRHNPATAGIPVIFLSGLADIREQTKDLDIAGVIQKNMPLSEIAVRIELFFESAAD